MQNKQGTIENKMHINKIHTALLKSSLYTSWLTSSSQQLSLKSNFDKGERVGGGRSLARTYRSGVTGRVLTRAGAEADSCVEPNRGGSGLVIEGESTVE